MHLSRKKVVLLQKMQWGKLAHRGNVQGLAGDLAAPHVETLEPVDVMALCADKLVLAHALGPRACRLVPADMQFPLVCRLVLVDALVLWVCRLELVVVPDDIAC